MVAQAAGATPIADAYIQGYAAAVLERELGVGERHLEVHEGVVTVNAEGLGPEDRAKVITALSSIRGVVRVVVEPVESSSSVPRAGQAAAESTGHEASAASVESRRPTRGPLATGWLRAGLLFDPLLADPRWPNFSAGYQRYVRDPAFRDVAAVSFGETFPFYRDSVPLHGQWEVGLQASVFAVFDLDAASHDLINADYFVGVPLTYREGPFSAMARVFHRSSHLGDEFLLRTRVNRVNLSYESIDAKLSYEPLGSEPFGPPLRLYGGAGYLFDQDPTNLKPWSTQFGFELRSPWTLLNEGVRPVFAADFQNHEENGWSTDVSLRAGLQFQNVQVLDRTLLWTFEYFKGHSPNGQFYNQRIDYFGIALHLYY